ncbi:energy-coupling factor transporter ATPase [Pseudoramibacter alactolyticus]
MEKQSIDPIIEVAHVSYAYPAEEGEAPHVALTDVSFAIERGKFVGIIGHNGSGKSTLSKLLNAIILPDAGDVRIKGMSTRDEKKIWDIRRSAGMVFQNPDNQLVSSVVETDVAFGMENLGVPSEQIRQKVDEVLGIVGMRDYRRAKPHQLSGGQKQRVAIAGILAMEPECIVFDEPTAMLDPNGRREVMATIRRLNREKGMTVLHITHYMAELVDADQIIVMDEGQKIMEGPPREVFARVEGLKKIGLDVPPMTELAHGLRADGFDVPADVLKIDEMVDALCR